MLKVNSRGKHNASLQTVQEAVQPRDQMFCFTSQSLRAVRWWRAWEAAGGGGAAHHLPHLLSARGSLLPPRAAHVHQAIGAACAAL